MATAAKPSGISIATVRLLPAVERVDGNAQGLRDPRQLFRLRVTSGPFPGEHRGGRHADAAAQLGLSDPLLEADRLDCFRALTSLTFSRVRDILTLLNA